MEPQETDYNEVAPNHATDTTCPSCGQKTLVQSFDRNFPGDLAETLECLNCGDTFTN